MQVATSSQNELSLRNRKPGKRLTPVDYSVAGILKLYDWSVKEREAHDKTMENYRRYLMKLCSLSHEIVGLPSAEDE
jgi:hypothetical protein